MMARSESKPYAQSVCLDPSEEYRELYCSLCDLYFKSKSLLRDHMESSDRHPRCDLCKKSFLNMNSLRRHYLLSNRHHYCTTCEKSFDTPLALRIHLDHTPYHREERNEFDDDTAYATERELYPYSWENGVAAEITRRENVEEEVIVAEQDELSRVQVVKKILELKQRISKQRSETSAKALKQTCPICLCAPKKMSVTRCGHLFCSSCISHAFEQGQGCPTCRKLGSVSQLRQVDLTVC
ncbi:hypothetical protein GYMLUDRAFT_220851 [Collybiopsis luxurians FD-317 M1]|nr:hypothetical protein GYMLUDRAFT_220851 [Collybiopsis luxurians FD-317 M1]